MALAIRRSPSLKAQVYGSLKDDILGSEPGTQLNSERELAERLGVSRPTVRSALAQLEDEGLVERRQGDGTFVTDRVKSRLIRVVFYHNAAGLEHDDGIYGRSYRAMRAALEHAGHRVQIFANPDPKHIVGPPVEDLPSDVPADAVVTLGIMNSDYIAGLAGLSDTLITVDYESGSVAADSVTFDSFGAGQVLGEHLVGLGHRRLAFIGAHRGVGGPDGNPRPELDSVRMRAGWEFAVLERGLEVRREWVLELSMNFPEPATEAARRMLAEAAPPTAIVCREARHAVAVVDFAMGLGLEVPADLSVACYGAVPTASDGRTTVTGVVMDMEEMGREAAAVILSRLENGGSRRSRVNIPGELVVGKSTGPAPSATGK